MEATTMNTAAPPSGSVSETQAARGSILFAPVTKVGALLRWIWWFDLGVVAITGRQVVRLVNAVVEKGKEVEPTVVKPFKKAEGAVGDALSDLGSRVKTTVKPTGPSDQETLRAELRDITAKVNELTDRIEGLQSKQLVGASEEPQAQAARAT